MSQVIEVRLLNPDTHEKLWDGFTLPETPKPYSKNNHTPMHRAAIQLAIKEMVGDAVEIGELRREDGPTFSGSGANTAWAYIYGCELIFLDAEENDKVRWMRAVCFAQWKEKEKEEK